MLTDALRYHGWGWCIIPAKPRDKRPAVSWKKYQTQRSTESELRKWLTKPANLAVMCGEVSGDLVIRDFDDIEVYRRWVEEYPQLARTLPTVKTGNGRHVYFRASREELQAVGLDAKVNYIKGGELRAGGGYSLLPPSVHPSGSTYRWLIFPGDSLPRLELGECGLLEPRECNREQREQRDNRRQQKTTEAMNEKGGKAPKAFSPPFGFEKIRPSNPNDPVMLGSIVDEVTQKIAKQNKARQTRNAPFDSAIERAIHGSLPEGPGVRNRQIFEFARALKAVPSLVEANPNDLRSFVETWHRLALPHISTQPFDETWIDFKRGWKRVKFPKGSEPMAAIVVRARENPGPEVEQRYDSQGIRLLIRLCRELQRASGDGPFYLSCHTAADLLGVSPTNAWRWLWALTDDEVLEVTERGKAGGRKATRYRYLAD